MKNLLCLGMCGYVYNRKTDTYQDLSLAEIEELNNSDSVQKKIKDVSFKEIQKKFL